MRFFAAFLLVITLACALAEDGDSSTTSTDTPVTFDDLPANLQEQCQENGEYKTMCDAAIEKFGGGGDKELVIYVVNYLMNPK